MASLLNLGRLFFIWNVLDLHRYLNIRVSFCLLTVPKFGEGILFQDGLKRFCGFQFNFKMAETLVFRTWFFDSLEIKLSTQFSIHFKSLSKTKTNEKQFLIGFSFYDFFFLDFEKQKHAVEIWATARNLTSFFNLECYH